VVAGCPHPSGNRKLLETRLPAGKCGRWDSLIDGNEVLALAWLWTHLLSFFQFFQHFHAKFYAIWLLKRSGILRDVLSSFYFSSYALWLSISISISFLFKFSTFAELCTEYRCAHFNHTHTHIHQSTAGHRLTIMQMTLASVWASKDLPSSSDLAFALLFSLLVLAFCALCVADTFLFTFHLQCQT